MVYIQVVIIEPLIQLHKSGIHIELTKDQTFHVCRLKSSQNTSMPPQSLLPFRRAFRLSGIFRFCLVVIFTINNAILLLNLSGIERRYFQTSLLQNTFFNLTVCGIILERRTTVSTFPVLGNISTQQAFSTLYPLAVNISKSLAKLVGLQET